MVLTAVAFVLYLLIAAPSHNCFSRKSSNSLLVRRLARTESSDYAATGGGVKVIIQALTSISNLLLPKSEVFERVYQKVDLTPSEVFDGVVGDFRNGYLFSGKIDSEIYDEECIFTDPTLSFKGLSTFERNIKAIKPALDFFVGDSMVVLYDCKIDLEMKEIKALWRMSGAIKLPWKPRIELTGNTVLSYDTEKGGRIVDYYERWDLPATTALLQLLQPSKPATKLVQLKGYTSPISDQELSIETGVTNTVDVQRMKSTILRYVQGKTADRSISASVVADTVSSLIRASSIEALAGEKTAAEVVRSLQDSSWELLYSTAEDDGELDALERLIVQIQGSSSPIISFRDIDSSDGVYNSIATAGPFAIQRASSCSQPDQERSLITIPRKQLKVRCFFSTKSETIIQMRLPVYEEVMAHCKCLNSNHVFILIIFTLYQVILFCGFPLKASPSFGLKGSKSGPTYWDLKYFDQNWRIFTSEEGDYFILRKKE